MTTANTQIAAELAPIFAELDADVLENSIKWIEARAEAVKAFWKSDEQHKMDTYALYARLFSLAGGKGWYNLISGSNAQIRAEHMAKHCAAVAAKRNATIAAKLVKAEVTEVISSELARSDDGFNGIFRVNTNKGIKRVKIETIIAGGYNIQCRHLRVLVNIK